MISRVLGPAREFLGFIRSDSSGAALARGGMGSLAMKLFHAVLTLAVAVLLARILGPDQFGVYTYAFAVVTILVVPIQFGLPLLVVRETAAGRVRSDVSAIQGIWRWSLRFVLLGSGIVLITASMLLAAGWTRLDSVFRWTFLWALPLAPLMALAALHGAALRGHDRVVIGQLPEHIIRLAIFTAFISIFIAMSADLTAPRAMVMHVVAAGITLLAANFLLRHVCPATSHFSRVDKARARRWMMATLPLGFIGAAQVINTRADTLLLGMLLDNQSVGIYQVAIQGAQIVTLGLAAINVVIAPHLVRLHDLGKKDDLQRLMRVSAQVVTCFTLVALLVLILFGDWLIRLVFGVEYQAAYLPLAILAAGQLVSAGFGLAPVLLNMSGHERVTAIGAAVSALINIALNLMLIPWAGMVGAAIATALSLLVLSAILWRSALGLIGVSTQPFGRI